MQIFAFGASNMTTSINACLARHAARAMATEISRVGEMRLLDLNEFEMPVYSPEREKKYGLPAATHAVHPAIKAADVLIVSFAEHNGSDTAIFKNILDWAPPIEVNVWQNEPALFVSTSVGEWGGRTVLATAVEAAPYLDGDARTHFEVGPKQEKFDEATESLSDPAPAKKLGEGSSLLTSETIPA